MNPRRPLRPEGVLVAAALATEVSASAVLANTSTRTLILGIDKAGRIRLHDRGSGDLLTGAAAAGEPSLLLGTPLSALLAVPGGPHAALLQSMTDAAVSGREGTTVLTLRTAAGATADAVVTIAPVRSADPALAAQVILRIAPPVAERFLDPAIMRQVMIDGAVRRAGGALDIDQMAPELIHILVPHFANSAGLVVLESLVAEDEFPTGPMDGSQPVRRLAVAHDDGDTAWDAAFPTGEILRYPAGTPFTRCMDTGAPVCEVISEASAQAIAAAWLRRPVAGLLSGASMLVLPLLAREVMRGFIVCVRRPGFRRFDAYDVEIGKEFAARAAMFMDNAQRYSRERATALTLQRSLLPTGLSAPSSVEVRHRYLPGSKLVEIGGDWYESIRLPGGRVALVVGDVAGHGVRAAVTMGRLRAAIHALAMLELPPAETLQRLDELMGELGAREPHFATCLYAIFDAVTGSCEIASAGHLPPLLVHPDGSNELLALDPAPPLGVGTGLIESRTLTVPDGSLLVLYTDGLVEKAQPRHRRGPAPAARGVRAGVGWPAAGGAVPGHPGRRLRRREPRRHRRSHRPAGAAAGREGGHLDAAGAADRRADGPAADRRAAGRLGAGRAGAGRRAAGIRAGHQRRPVRPGQRRAAAGPRGRAGVRGAG
jgi:hypothetical protein